MMLMDLGIQEEELDDVMVKDEYATPLKQLDGWCWCNNLPPYFLEIVVINSVGTNIFASAHRVTSP